MIRNCVNKSLWRLSYQSSLWRRLYAPILPLRATVHAPRERSETFYVFLRTNIPRLPKKESTTDWKNLRNILTGSDIAGYLVSLKYNKARDHLEEAEEFQETLAKCSEEIFTVLHERQVANPAVTQPVAAPAQAARQLSKASASELKPERLTHDASASAFRSWKKCFRAYYDSAQMGSLPCSQQQAYLCNCIDSTLHARIDREATATTPVYSPIVGLYTCIAILDQVFLEAYPIHVRRKLFFDARQKEGQSALEFREELLSLLEEADAQI